MADEKKVHAPKVHMGESLYLALSQLAELEDLALSTYLERVLTRHAFGHLRVPSPRGEGPERPESAR